jgi:hypothetical protein
LEKISQDLQITKVTNDVIVGRDSSVGIATLCGLDCPGIESRYRARFSAPVQTSAEAHPAFHTMGLYSTSRPSWPVYRLTFTFAFNK